MTLQGKQILVEALDGLLLQHVVDPISSVQHPDLHLRLLFSLEVWAFMLCDKRHHSDSRGELGVTLLRQRTCMRTIVHVLLLFLDLVGYDGQLGLQGGRGVGPGELVERLPGAPQRADETVLQVRAHPGETLLQL